MSKRLPPLNALKAFEAAARHMSFTLAADELFVTQAAVSHQIKQLETFLDIKLFQRKNRSLLLTEEGQNYYLDIKDSFASIIKATDKLLDSGGRGILTISLPPSFAVQWLVPRLTDFNQKHPEIDVRIKAVDKEEGSLTDDADVAIYYGKGKWKGIQFDKLYQEYLIPLCSPALLHCETPLRTLEHLPQFPLLHDVTREDWQQFAKEHQLSTLAFKDGPIFSHSLMVLQAAVHGQGICLGNNILAQPELASGRLVAPFKQKITKPEAFYVVCKEDEADLGKVAIFREWIRKTAQQEEYELLKEWSN
ncbi:transcriptional regulator GcvA [Vibrio sp.]|nr:transcriptional regulator GcvA [Vibrio sp.]